MDPSSNSYFVGLDAGIRGGAGIGVVDSAGGLIMAERIKRDPLESTIQMFVRVRNRIVQIVQHYKPLMVAREDHVFPGSLETIARIFLRRQNGAVDVAMHDAGYRENYLAFPVNTWKAIIGVAGDFGKEHAGMAKGQQNVLGSKSKKNTTAFYLAAMNERLGYVHPDVDSADAHGIALALRTVWAVRTLNRKFLDLPLNSQSALWDRPRSDSTVAQMLRRHPEVFESSEKLSLCLKTFAP